MMSFSRLLRFAIVFLLLAGILLWTAFRKGWIPTQPILIAVVASSILLLVLVDLLIRLRRLYQEKPRPLSAGAELLIDLGLLLILTGGMLNWLFSLQGFVILSEFDAVPLSMTSHLQEFDAGPLSDVDEMQLTLQLEKFDLLPVAEGGFHPWSRLRFLKEGYDPITLEVQPGKIASVGTLRFRQGAFGFSPRIVILREQSQIFDENIPFITRREEPGTVRFEEEFTIRKEGLHVRGEVVLQTLDEWMRGHPVLGLEVKKGDEILGTGTLLPGHFADLKDGYRVGFAGLKKWTEIDISRKNYPLPMFVGSGMVLLGIITWPVLRKMTKRPQEETSGE